MKSSSIAVLAAGALALAGVAGLVMSRRGEAPASVAGKLFPGLSGKINEAARVEILRGGQQTVLARAADGAWSVESKGGYPAEFENVKTLIIGLSKSEILEEKTANPENYARIGVEDPAPTSAVMTPEALGSTQVTLKDAGGQILASVILGNTPPSSGGFSVEQAKFARRAGEKQSYLIKPAPNAEPGILTWVNREVLKIDGTRIQSVKVSTTQPLEAPSASDAPSLAPPPLPQDVLIERVQGSANEPLGKFEFKNMPPGRELKSMGQEGQIASALAYVDMEDVALAADVASAPIIATAEYRTKDGLAVVLTTREKDGKTWGTFQASAFAVLPPARAEDQPADASAGAEKEKKVEAKAGEAVAGPGVPAIDPKIEDEAKGLNARLGRWAFAIPAWKAGSFKSNWKELLKEPAPATETPGPVGPVAPAGAGERPPG